MALDPGARREDSVGDVVHDLNNPLGSVHANLSQLAEYAEDLQAVWEEVRAVRKASRTGVGLDGAARALSRRMDEADADFLVDDLSAAVRDSLAGTSQIRRILRALRIADAGTS